jgi:DNA polymerase V
MKVLPIFQTGITGFESPAAEYIELGLSLDAILIEHPNATFIGRAAGDSMQGDGIFDGDLIIVDRSQTVNHLDIIVACFNGEFVCKRIDFNRRLLLSSSVRYPPVVIHDLDNLAVEGVVTRSIRIFKSVDKLCTL